MANWNSLKPLKIHSVILKIVAAIFIIILIFTPKHAFRTSSINPKIYNSENISYVSAYKGLSIRDQPEKRGTLLTTAPFKAKLTILEKDVALDKINGKRGYWYKVDYQGTIGYAFSSFIKNEE